MKAAEMNALTVKGSMGSHVTLPPFEFQLCHRENLDHLNIFKLILSVKWENSTIPWIV